MRGEVELDVFRPAARHDAFDGPMHLGGGDVGKDLQHATAEQLLRRAPHQAETGRVDAPIAEGAVQLKVAISQLIEDIARPTRRAWERRRIDRRRRGGVHAAEFSGFATLHAAPGARALARSLHNPVAKPGVRAHRDLSSI